VNYKMPFAGFKDWADCQRKLAKKYPDKKKRDKVCGKLQARDEKHEQLKLLKQEIAKEKECLEEIGKELKNIKDKVK